MSEPIVMSLDQFLGLRQAPNVLEDHGGLRYPNGISKAERRRIHQRLQKRMAELTVRDDLRAEYELLVEEGVIRPPTRLERLERTARGHPDNDSVQAARRILAGLGR
jgi:hypothetical protein